MRWSHRTAPICWHTLPDGTETTEEGEGATTAIHRCTSVLGSFDLLVQPAQYLHHFVTLPSKPKCQDAINKCWFKLDVPTFLGRECRLKYPLECNIYIYSVPYRPAETGEENDVAMFRKSCSSRMRLVWCRMYPHCTNVSRARYFGQYYGDSYLTTRVDYPKYTNT